MLEFEALRYIAVVAFEMAGPVYVIVRVGERVGRQVGWNGMLEHT